MITPITAGRIKLAGAFLITSVVWRGVCDELEDYGNPNDDYKPDDAHKRAHRISGEDFDTDEEYLSAVLLTPIILCSLGLAALVLVDILACCCTPKFKTKRELETTWYIFYFLSVGAIISIFFVYLGFAGLEDGVDKFDDSVTVIKDAFDVLVDDGKTLEQNYDTMIVNCDDSPACCDYTNNHH